MSATSAHHAVCTPIAERHMCYKFVCDTRATHCPCQRKTGPVSSRHTHMSMVYTPLFTSSSMTVSFRLLRMCGFFSSSTTTLPACTTFLTEIKGFTMFALLNSMHLCTPSTDVNGMVFSPKSLIFSPFAVTNFVAALVRNNFTRGNISAGMTCPAAPVLIMDLMFTQLSLTSMTFHGDAQVKFSTLSNDLWTSFLKLQF